jgi:hypothetical protein
MRLWDPKTREVTLRVSGSFPADTHGNLVAWCGEPCPRFHITDARSGETTRVRPPAGFSFQATYDGAFSPDGSLLALPMHSDRGDRGRDQKERWRVALVDAGSGTARLIRGSVLDPTYQAMAWSASGARLFFGAGGGRIMGYRPDSPRATTFSRIPVRPGGTIMTMVAL